MKIVQCEQGSCEWLEARAGVVTASEMDELVTPLWKVREAKSVDAYVARKLAEKWSGPLPSFNSFAMEQGSVLEDRARPWLSVLLNTEIEKVGLITTDDGRAGCSPDGIYSDGKDRIGVEIKCPESPAHVRYVLAGILPPDYRAQVQMSLWVSGFPAWQFLSYRRHYPNLILTIEPDEQAHESISLALELFGEKFDAGWARLLDLNGGPPPPRATMVFSTDRRESDPNDVGS